MKSNIILGSGLTALICKKILGSDWQIIPIGPSRFYSNGVPALGDDFIVHDKKIDEIIQEWDIRNTIPIFYKRPFSYGGELIHNNMFLENHLHKMHHEFNEVVNEYYKTTFLVYPFSCLQLHQKLLRENTDEITKFLTKHKDAKSIKLIKDHKIILDNNTTLEYDNLISTIPYNALCSMLHIKYDNPKFLGIYYYFIKDDSLNLENANQVLICDYEISFHKCTTIKKYHYLIECLEYDDDIYNTLSRILGNGFEILSAKYVKESHVLPGLIHDQYLNANNIICIGSYAQCDPMIDIGSTIKRIHNLKTKKMI